MTRELNQETALNLSENKENQELQATTQEQVKAAAVPTVKVAPRVDLIETADGFSITAELPGVSEDHIDLSIEKRVLTIHGKSANRERDGFKKLHGQNLNREFYADFRLSDEVDTESIQAAFEDGLLTLQLGKLGPARKRKIAINAG